MIGYIAVENEADAIDKGYVFRFVKKPLIGEEVKQAVKIAVINAKVRNVGFL